MKTAFLIPKRDTPASKAICNFLKSLLWIKSGRREGQGKPPRGGGLKSQSGQVIIEYILLLIVAVGLATLITKGLVGRNHENPGVLTGAWANINRTIGADIID